MLGCPKCKKIKTIVIDSRYSGTAIRRRRLCLDCSHRYTTYERLETEIIIKNEEQETLRTYRKQFPQDTRSDKKILESIKYIKENFTEDSLIYWAANIQGIINAS